MISLRKFLDLGEVGGAPAAPAAAGDLELALQQALRLMIENLPLHEGPGGDGDPRHRARLQRLASRLQSRLAPIDPMEIATEAIETCQLDKAEAEARFRQAERSWKERGDGELVLVLQQALQISSPEDVQGIVQEALAFSARGSKAAQFRHRRHTEELQAIIAMLSNTVAALVRHRAGSVARLQQIERRIEQTSHAEDLFALKSLLADCLQELRENVESQRKQSDETLQVFERQLASARARLAGPAPAGPQEDDRRAASGPDGSCTELVVAFLLDREQSIASRFGGDVHQRVLRFVHERLRQSLLPSDRLVRWKSAVFLASLQRSGSWQEIRAELASVASIHAPPLIDLGSRSIRLPISLSWAVFPRQRFASLESLFQKVDDFVARTGNRPEA